MSGGHGRPSGASPGIAWALIVIAAALIGGLAAAALVHVSLAVAVAVSVVAGGIAIFAAARLPGSVNRSQDPLGREGLPGTTRGPVPASMPGPAHVPGATYVPEDPRRPGHARRRPGGPRPDALTTGQPPETVVQLLPASPNEPRNEPRNEPGQERQEWWDAAQGAPPAPSAAAKRAPAPDLSSYLASTIITQCPNCGGFRLDYRRAGNGWEFRCESCRHIWAWQHGTPWPPVRVAPTRRTELRLCLMKGNERHT